MKKRWLTMLVVVALLTGAGNVYADLIFNSTDIGQNLSYATTAQWYAQRFDLGGQSYTLDSITLRLDVDGLGGTANLDLYTNSAGAKPGTFVGSVTQAAAGGIGETLFSFASLNYTLQASTSYWAVLTGFTSGSGGWTYNSSGSFPLGVYAAPGADEDADWGFVFSPDSFQMKVNGTLQNAAVPEPSTFVLLGGIMVGAFAYRRRRMSRKDVA